MDFLIPILERISTRLSESELLQSEQVSNVLNHTALLEEHGAFVSFQSIGKTPYFKVINDAHRDFHGFTDNDITSMNLGFYYRYMRRRQLPLLVQAYQFQLRNDPGYFSSTQGLKNADGIFEDVHTVMKIVAWNELGKPAYALAVGCKNQDTEWFKAAEKFDLYQLKEREKNCLTALLDGDSNDEISLKLDVSRATIEKIVQRVFQHCQVSNRAEFFAQLNES